MSPGKQSIKGRCDDLLLPDDHFGYFRLEQANLWRELIEHANEPKVIATLDYLVFALANAELLVPEQASIVKANVNSTLIGLLV